MKLLLSPHAVKIYEYLNSIQESCVNLLLLTRSEKLQKDLPKLNAERLLEEKSLFNKTSKLKRIENSIK